MHGVGEPRLLDRRLLACLEARVLGRGEQLEVVVAALAAGRGSASSSWRATRS